MSYISLHFITLFKINRQKKRSTKKRQQNDDKFSCSFTFFWLTQYSNILIYM